MKMMMIVFEQQQIVSEKLTLAINTRLDRIARILKVRQPCFYNDGFHNNNVLCSYNMQHTTVSWFKFYYIITQIQFFLKKFNLQTM